MLCFYVLLQILSTTITILAEISPVIPVALFAGFSLVSLTYSILVPYFHKSTFVFQNRSKPQFSWQISRKVNHLSVPQQTWSNLHFDFLRRAGFSLFSCPKLTEPPFLILRSKAKRWHDAMMTQFISTTVFATLTISFNEKNYDCSNVCDIFGTNSQSIDTFDLVPLPRFLLSKEGNSCSSR